MVPADFLAISNRLMRRSVPTTVSHPSRYSMSPTEASSRFAAFSITSSIGLAMTVAVG